MTEQQRPPRTIMYKCSDDKAVKVIKQEDSGDESPATSGIKFKTNKKSST